MCVPEDVWVWRYYGLCLEDGDCFVAEDSTVGRANVEAPDAAVLDAGLENVL